MEFEFTFTKYTNETNIGFCGNLTAYRNWHRFLYGHLYPFNPSSGKQDNTHKCHRLLLHFASKVVTFISWYIRKMKKVIHLCHLTN